jgi:hypothetical protein
MNGDILTNISYLGMVSTYSMYSMSPDMQFEAESWQKVLPLKKHLFCWKVGFSARKNDLSRRKADFFLPLQHPYTFRIWPWLVNIASLSFFRNYRSLIIVCCHTAPTCDMQKIFSWTVCAVDVKKLVFCVPGSFKANISKCQSRTFKNKQHKIVLKLKTF